MTDCSFCSVCSYEVIVGMVPESHRKLLINIRKTQERAKRKRKEADNNDDDNQEEGGDIFSSKQKPERCVSITVSPLHW